MSNTPLQWWLTGKPRSTPVTPTVVDGKRYVVGGIPGSDRAADVRAAGRCPLFRMDSVNA